MQLDFQPDVSLRPFNTFAIDTRARLYVEIGSDAALCALLGTREWRDQRRLVLGGGSNVLFTRDFDGLVVRIASRGVTVTDAGDAAIVVAEAGEGWDALVRRCLALDLPGLENLVAIPGSVGASPVQNIGAYGVELAERFAWLDALDLDDGRIVRMDAAACAFGYRDSVFKGALRERRTIVRVAFRLPHAWRAVTGYGDVAARLAAAGIDAPSASDIADAVTAIRRDKLPDPGVLGNAGSFFKNPLVPAGTFDRIRALDDGVVGHRQLDGRVKLAAGWLVDRCGWRGRSLPGSDRVAVHERQALVLVNRGGASGADVLALADAVTASVEARFGIVLELEPLIV